MARRKLWDANKTGFITVATTAVQLSVVESTIGGRDIDGTTLTRMVGTVAVRTADVVQTAGWVHLIWIIKIQSLDSADLTPSDFDANSVGQYHSEDVPLTGYASDSTTLADQRPLTVVKFDTSNMRKVRSAEALFVAIQNDHPSTIEVSVMTRTLWTLT